MRVVLDEAPGATGGCAVVGAVDGARAADLVGEVVDDSLGWRRDAALAFDETNFDDSVLDMERVVVLTNKAQVLALFYVLVFVRAQAP